MKLLIQLGHTLIIKYVSVNTFANTSNINRFLEEVMVLNSPPGSLQLRPYVMVVLLFQLSGRRRGTIWLRRSLPLHLQVKRTFKQNIVVCVSIPLVSWCFTSMRGQSNCDYGSTQNTQKSFLETVCRSRHIQYVRYGWSLNQVYLLCTHLWHREALTWDGTFLGGSIRIVGSHSPGGRTVTWSRNSSIPERRSVRSLALYATSWKIYIMNFIKCLCNMMFNCSQQAQKFTLCSRRGQCTRWNITSPACMLNPN